MDQTAATAFSSSPLWAAVAALEATIKTVWLAALAAAAPMAQAAQAVALALPVRVTTAAAALLPTFRAVAVAAQVRPATLAQPTVTAARAVRLPLQAARSHTLVVAAVQDEPARLASEVLAAAVMVPRASAAVSMQPLELQTPAAVVVVVPVLAAPHATAQTAALVWSSFVTPTPIPPLPQRLVHRLTRRPAATTSTNSRPLARSRSKGSTWLTSHNWTTTMWSRRWS